MVVNGSLSKTAINGSAGARSQLSGLVVATLTIVTLLYLTELFEDLPEARPLRSSRTHLADKDGFDVSLRRTREKRMALQHPRRPASVIELADSEVAPGSHSPAKRDKTRPPTTSAKPHRYAQNPHVSAPS